VNSVDSLKVSRYAAGLTYSQNEPCTNIGTKLPNEVKQGNVDCDGSVNSIDSLKISRYLAGLSYSQSEPCPNIGSFK
jgi:hypothetical protein